MKKSRFTKLDNKLKNLHSQDVKQEQIASGDPSFNKKYKDELQNEPWKDKKK